MYAIQLDTNDYLKDLGNDTWKYTPKKDATKFASLNAANAYMLENEIKFMAPSAKVVKI